MCTMTFVAGLPDGGYVLTTNRDERRTRGRARPPAIERLGGRRVALPRDPDAGGTWVAADEHGTCLCLMNGDAPAPGVVADPGAPSRGLLVADLLARERPDAIAPALARRLRGKRVRENPFVLLVARRGRGGARASLARHAWDGRTLRTTARGAWDLDTSSGVEPERVRRLRRDAFVRLVRDAEEGVPGLGGPLAGGDVARLLERLAAFHTGHQPGRAPGDAFSVCMHRDEVSTVSMTRVEVVGARVSMIYRDGQPCTAPAELSCHLTA